MPYIVKPMDELMAEHTDWHTLQAHCELFVSFGGVPRKNAQIAVGGTAQHHVRDGLHRLADHGVRFVNISSVRTDRSEERRVGQECVSTSRSRWARYPEQNSTQTKNAVSCQLVHDSRGLIKNNSI